MLAAFDLQLHEGAHSGAVSQVLSMVFCPLSDLDICRSPLMYVLLRTGGAFLLSLALAESEHTPSLQIYFL